VKAVAAYRDLGRKEAEPAERGVQSLLRSQGPDGGWGGVAGVTCSVEETAAAVDALSGWMVRPAVREAVLRGGRWLAERIAASAIDNPSPIGLYFTKLWYSERLYPILWSCEALGRVLGVTEGAQRESDSLSR
jgi:squalene-hopene/tetraprenyl-beta-curcumene cyclase